MPALVPILVGIAAAGSIGSTVYGLTKGGGGGGQQPQPDPNAALNQQAQTNAANQASERAQIARQVPSIQSQLGGSVSPDYYAAEAAQEAGFPGDQNVARTALANFLGLGSTPESQGVSGTQFGGASQGFQFNPLSITQDKPEQEGISGGFS